MKVKQIIALVIVVALLMTGSVLVTMAYLTDTQTVRNVFTVGNIDMKLDETDVDLNGNPEKDAEGNVLRTEEGNTYHLMPGHRYVKDPTVTVFANSEECYVRLMVKVSNYAALNAAFPSEKYPQFYQTIGGRTFFALEGLVEGYNAAAWNCVDLKVAGDGSATYEFRYKTTVAKSTSDTPLEPLFTHVVIPGNVANDALQLINNLTIDVTAHAIQIDGFNNDIADAWAAFDLEYATNADDTTTTTSIEPETEVDGL